jgi:hypothetical protein
LIELTDGYGGKPESSTESTEFTSLHNSSKLQANWLGCARCYTARIAHYQGLRHGTIKKTACPNRRGARRFRAGQSSPYRSRITDRDGRWMCEISATAGTSRESFIVERTHMIEQHLYAMERAARAGKLDFLAHLISVARLAAETGRADRECEIPR